MEVDVVNMDEIKAMQLMIATNTARIQLLEQFVCEEHVRTVKMFQDMCHCVNELQKQIITVNDNVQEVADKFNQFTGTAQVSLWLMGSIKTCLLSHLPLSISRILIPQQVYVTRNVSRLRVHLCHPFSMPCRLELPVVRFKEFSAWRCPP